ncbi:MAG: protein kinase [Candidatus Neomarinimicrobiota bacterium]
MIGKTISHYKILEKLGEGGMGDVYKAEDTNLDRIVALKFLPKEVTRDKEMKTRFIHEAKAASALDHPNVCTVFEIDETEEGQLFISMGYYDGDTIEERIKQGPLEINEALNITIQVAQGLDKAHKKKIVHRDIKSANIIVNTDGVTKIVDFGIAKLAGQTKVTKDGTSLGTASYMSPEQTLGKEVDHRTDIWSLGVVLYEMLTGLQPFQGDYEQAVVYSIMNEEPKPLTGLRTGIPLQLEQIVSKALAKEPDERYQHLDELIVDLKHVKKEPVKEKTDAQVPLPPTPVDIKPFWKQPIPMAVSITALIVIITGLLIFGGKTDEPASRLGDKSIAVLPFSAIGDSKEDEYFSDGIHDDILTQLSKIGDLKVIARTSVMQYKNTNLRISDIGKELGVASILEGSVRRAGDKIRIVAQLIKSNTEEHLWAETYDRDYADIFAIQSDVAQKIASALKATLNPEEKEQLEAVPTNNMEAYNNYLRGNIFIFKGVKEESIRSAIQFYEKAIELDPNFTLAYARLSVAYMRILWFADYYNYLQLAKETLDKAASIDANHPDIRLAFGYYYYYGFRDFDKALREFTIALKTQPNNDQLIEAIGWIKRRQGKWDESVQFTKLACELNPHTANRHAQLAYTYIYLRDWDEAIRYSEMSINIAPDEPQGYSIRGYIILAMEGDVEKTRQFIRDNLDHVDSSKFVFERGLTELLGRNYQKALGIFKEDEKTFLLAIAHIYRLMGQETEAERYYDSARKQFEMKIKDNPNNGRFYGKLGITYAGLGRKEEAINAGKQGIEMIPVSKDALSGSVLLNDMVILYTMTGEVELAISQIEEYLSYPSWLTVQFFKLHPGWDSLRAHPRFQELIARYSD